MFIVRVRFLTIMASRKALLFALRLLALRLLALRLVGDPCLFVVNDASGCITETACLICETGKSGGYELGRNERALRWVTSHNRGDSKSAHACAAP